MRDKMYIPETIHVGFQKRDSTFTGKLGYIVYTDEKGKLRKEASWNSWRDQKIQPLVINNTPQDGFTFNKGIQRDRYWGSGRSVIRVYDQRDFEFEITVDNLIGILMHSDVSKRDITEKCVYAWYGKELVLLPVNSVEYQESLKHTAKMNSKFSAKDLVVGHTYSIKNEDKGFVYIGYMERFETYESKIYYELHGEDLYSNYNSKQMKLIPFSVKRKQKQHMFIEEDAKMEGDYRRGKIRNLQPTVHIANTLDDKIHDRYAELYQVYLHDTESSKISDIKIIQKKIKGTGEIYSARFENITLNMLWEINDTTRLSINLNINNYSYDSGKRMHIIKGLRVNSDYYYVMTDNGVYKAKNSHRVTRYYYGDNQFMYIHKPPTEIDIYARFPGLREYVMKLNPNCSTAEEINEVLEYMFKNFGIGTRALVNDVGKNIPIN